MSKHIAVRYHYIRDLQETGVIDVDYISTTDQRADMLTKNLGRVQLERLRGMVMSVVGAPASTAFFPVFGNRRSRRRCLGATGRGGCLGGSSLLIVVALRRRRDHVTCPVGVPCGPVVNAFYFNHIHIIISQTRESNPGTFSLGRDREKTKTHKRVFPELPCSGVPKQRVLSLIHI